MRASEQSSDQDGQEPEKYYWKGQEVPKDAYDALHAPYRGQAGIGPKHTWVLDTFWRDEPELVVPNRDPIDYRKHVYTHLTFKYDEKLTKKLVYGKINVGKVLNAMFTSNRVPDEVRASN